MRDFTFLQPQSLEEACSLLAQHGDAARLLAGGNYLVFFLKQRLIGPQYVIDLRSIPGLDQLSYEPGRGLRIGALVTHRALERSPLVQERFPIIASMAAKVANVRVRNTGTIGGNLAFAEPQSDPPTLFLALEAVVTAQSARGRRELPLTEFFVDYYQTALEPDEILTEVRVPELPPGTRGLYYKFTTRSEAAKPCVSLAILVSRDGQGEPCREARIAMGAVGPTPLRARGAEALLRGQSLDEALIEEAARLTSQECDPASDLYGSAWYKREIVKVLIRRGLQECLRQGPGA